jgi:archaeal type IV pilus assembly protein PilA
MSLKKLLKNIDAVSPIISTTLMVAITVALAAIVAQHAFNQENAKSAPMANIDISADGINNSVASVKLENFGGGPIHFENSNKTIVVASLNEGDSVNIPAVGLGVLGVGFVKTLKLASDGDGKTGTLNAFAVTPELGDTINIKIVDVKANQVICDKDVIFEI